jgi:hypothetical protein
MNLRRAVCGLLLGGLLGAAAPAAADSLTEIPARPRLTPLSRRVTDNLTLLSEELNTHLSTLSLELVDMRFDFTRRTARLKLDLGDHEQFGLRIDSDIRFRAGYARVNARIDLTLVGTALSLELPEFDMVPQSYLGQRWVEVRLPLFERTF